MAKHESSVAASLSPEDNLAADQCEQEAMEAKDRTSTATSATDRSEHVGGLGVYGGYIVTRAGQVVVDTARVFADPTTLKQALRVAKRAQEIGRRTSRDG